MQRRKMRRQQAARFIDHREVADHEPAAVKVDEHGRVGFATRERRRRVDTRSESGRAAPGCRDARRRFRSRSAPEYRSVSTRKHRRSRRAPAAGVSVSRRAAGPAARRRVEKGPRLRVEVRRVRSSAVRSSLSKPSCRESSPAIGARRYRELLDPVRPSCASSDPTPTSRRCSRRRRSKIGTARQRTPSSISSLSTEKPFLRIVREFVLRAPRDA